MHASPRTAGIALALALCVAAWPRRASAEPGSVQLFGGYAAVRDTSIRLTFKSGWTAGAAVAVMPWLSLVADIDHQTAAHPVFDGGSTFQFSSYGYLTGLRATGHLGVFDEFGQVLLGGVRSTGSVFGDSTTTEHAAVQPGVGLDYPLARHWSARGEFDVRLLDTGNDLRAVAAIVFRVR